MGRSRRAGASDAAGMSELLCEARDQARKPSAGGQSRGGRYGVERAGARVGEREVGAENSKGRGVVDAEAVVELADGGMDASGVNEGPVVLEGEDVEGWIGGGEA